MVVTNLPFEALLSPLRDVDVDLLLPEYRSYTSYTGESVAHSCDKMGSGWEAGFCDDSELYFLTSARGDLRYQGFSYACKRHLRSLVFEFAQTLEEKSLDIQYDEWCDAENAREQREDGVEEAAAL